MTCTVKGYQECPFSVDVGKSFEFLRKSVPKKCKRKCISEFYRRFVLFYKIYILPNIDIQFDIWTFFYLFHSIKIHYDQSCVIYLSRDGFRTKSNRIEFDCVRLCSSVFVENRTHSKIDVRLPNPIERLVFDWVRLIFGSILFDWIRRDICKFLSNLEFQRSRIKTPEGSSFLNIIALHFIGLHCIALHSIAWHFIVLYYMEFIALHCVVLQPEY